MRGNQLAGLIAQGNSGSIPACAGEPKVAKIVKRFYRVYPRVCGGTSSSSRTTRRCWGLSPRVRGNRARAILGRENIWSIPACAGEPDQRRNTGAIHKVYPRVCGGTGGRRCAGAASNGLSPRVRGNRVDKPRSALRIRSIPACAGEPGYRAQTPDRASVYPRVCGGTAATGKTGHIPSGLSPRVRGNRLCNQLPLHHSRSIPACAGEPTGCAMRSTSRKVYPRVCGGTVSEISEKIDAGGLSPRVRGNLRPPLRRRVGRGSIPACAGEPLKFFHHGSEVEVYPRVCGGTITRLWPLAAQMGLSPRVRGNRLGRPRPSGPGGSIPACAGEPSLGSAGIGESGVYPRVCGGTPKRSLFVSTSAKELPPNCTSPGRSRQHRLSPSAPLPIPEFAGRLPPMAPSRSLLSNPAASRHTTQPILSRPSPLCRLSCLATCIRRALSPTLPRPENLDNALRH